MGLLVSDDRRPRSTKADRSGAAPLEACQRSAQTEVRTLAECEVPVRIARDVQGVGIGELMLVPVGRPQDARHQLTRPDGHGSEGDVLPRQAYARDLQRAREP